MSVFSIMPLGCEVDSRYKVLGTGLCVSYTVIFVKRTLAAVGIQLKVRQPPKVLFCFCNVFSFVQKTPRVAALPLQS